ncbi:hypothetical protein FAM09_03230 [Niastella caeni]|uniref:Uncharacterized protein n=1 Tax=Niastella caeni TaxID=2569763 RepID=A0A4S8I0E1_9BACT|nr:hypothetical protein [Niastella caeni]THU41141.1 hypothetical protein FAM09_03230 [Niastella caeni]
MKIKRSVYIFLLAFVIMLVVVSGCLFKQTVDYKWENRELILQNDSLRGVVIELTRKLDTTKTAATGIILKTAN